MAKNPEVDDSGALALRPQRVNIFARPATSTAERASRQQPKSIFDPAAACQPSEGADRDHRADSARLRLAGVSRLVAVVGLAVVIALVALQPSGTATIDRSRPSVPRHDARPSSRSDERVRDRVPDGKRRARPRKRAKPHRLPRPHRRQASTPPGAIPRPRISPRPAPPPPAPRRSAPTGPLPAPVSPTSPPEFM